MPDSTLSRPVIVYLHIPKTAGMTINGFLDKTYRDRPHYTTHLPDVITAANWAEGQSKIRDMSAAERDGYGLFKGHMFFGLHELLKSPVEYIGFVRDPVKRAVSHYKMLHRYEVIPHGHVLDVSRPDWNLAGHEAFHRSLDNYQVRIIAGVDPSLPFGAVTDAHLQQAIANIEKHFTFVGLTDQFDLSLLLLRRVCGWGWHFYKPNNVWPDPPVEIPAAAMDALREVNRFDLALYRHAEERMRKLTDQFGGGLRTEHRLYVRGNAIHRKYDDWRRGLKRRLGLGKKSTPEAAQPRSTA